MLNKIMLATFFLCLMCGNAVAEESAKYGIVELEKAFESKKLKIRMTNDLKGTIVGRTCDQCMEQTVTITPETLAFNRNQSVPLIEAKKRYGKSALVIYDIKTKLVNEIRWP